MEVYRREGLSPQEGEDKEQGGWGGQCSGGSGGSVLMAPILVSFSFTQLAALTAEV